MSYVTKFLDKYKKAGDSLRRLDNYILSENIQDKFVSTGIPVLNYGLGTGGFPTGIMEFAGPSKSGKTTIGLHAIKAHQEKYGDRSIAFMLYSERRDIIDYATTIGIDPSKVLIPDFRVVEELPAICKNLLDNFNQLAIDENVEGGFKYIFVWDSIGETLSASEYQAILEQSKAYLKKVFVKGEDSTDVEMKHANPGSFAKSAKGFSKFLKSEIYSQDIIFIAINHTYASIGGGPFAKDVSAGGKWIEYAPAIRLRLSRMKAIKDGDIEIGQITRIKFEKNDFNDSKEPVDIAIIYSFGAALTERDIEFAVEQGIIEKISARKYRYSDNLEWGSIGEFYRLCKTDNPDIVKLNKDVEEAYNAMLESKREEHKNMMQSKNEKLRQNIKQNETTVIENNG